MKTWMKWGIGALLALLIIGVVFVTTQTTPIVKTKTITLTVTSQPGDYTIAVLDTMTIKAGDTGGMTVNVQPLLGFSRPVKFTLGGQMPVGMTVTWTGGVDTWTPGMTGNLQMNLAVPLDNGLAGTYNMVLTGTSQ